MSEFFKAVLTKWFLEPSQPKPRLTEDELMIRLKVFIGMCLALTLIGIVFVVLYSIIFVTQPLNAISPIDQKFFELIIPVATFLTGTLSGIMLAGKDPNSASSASPKPAITSAPKPVSAPAPAPAVAKKEPVLDIDEDDIG